MVGALLLASILGFLIGRTLGLSHAFSPIPMEVVEDLRPKEAVIILEGLRDGKIVGSVEGDVRLWIGDEQVLPDEEGKIAEKPGVLLVNEVSVLVPEGMQFVASKRGKKYYPVLAKSGENITPGNRIYFEDAKSAERAGYHQ